MTEWNVLSETVHKHVYTVNKQVLIKRRDWCSNNSKELRSEKHHATTAIMLMRDFNDFTQLYSGHVIRAMGYQRHHDPRLVL